jgi:2-polyprenyl-6-methoxyphenol hydroxylase-like FAD-dependent oxidoreductase
VTEPQVLIVGAGPTGLNLALRLARYGTPFRIIDEHDRPAQESRALAVHARTLEFYKQLGLADAIVAGGTEIRGVRLHEAGRERAHVVMRDIGDGLSPYPFILDFPQDEHEHFLVEHLRGQGIEVERSTSLVRFSQDEEGVDAVLSSACGGEERVRFSYICGCDGARSMVRDEMGTGFSGGTYQHLYYVADVRLEEPDASHDLHLATGVDTFALRLPARKGAMERLIGFIPNGIEHPEFAHVRASAEHLLRIKVAELNWFSAYRVHHRVADRFRMGRAFLLGDAGHLHSPVGGQGMNTGIGDAVNLSWKLAHVLQGRASPALLNTYEPERIAFARSLVATTDRMFKITVSGGVAGRLFRTFVMPTLLPTAMRFEAGRRAFFRFASQIRIRYPQSALSSGSAGSISGGDRLPWLSELDNYAPLANLDWQLHVHGEVTAEVSEATNLLGLQLCRFPWQDRWVAAGLARDAAYLVRPDGYVALAMAEPSAATLRAYVDQHGLSFRGNRASASTPDPPRA